MAKHKKISEPVIYRGQDVKAEVNKYYLTVSGRFMKAKFITLLILIVFFAFMLIRYSDDITYSNLMYLMRDFNTDRQASTTVFEPVEYDEQENMNFSLYRGELSVIGNRSLKMYNVRGIETRTYEPAYSDPVLVSSDKYLLAYNVGTPDYSVYTSIARVNNGMAQGDIENAHMNNRGEYLLVCRSKDTKYVVCTYDSSFRPIAEYYKTRYVTTAAIGEKGQVVIASFDSKNGVYDCEIELYSDGSDKADVVYSASGVFPVKCGIWKDGGYFVICTDRVLFFDKNGALLSSVEAAYEYTAYSQGSDSLAISYDNDSIGGSSTVFVFDTAGEMLYNQVIDGSITSLSLSEDNMYALASSKAYMINIKNKAVAEQEVNEGGAVLVSNGGTCIICYRSGAQGLLFSDSEADAVPNDTAADVSKQN